MSNAQKFFDLHIEVGQNNDGSFYAKTILGIKGGIELESAGKMSPADAIGELSFDMERAGYWATLAQNPAVCQYPFPGPQTPLAITIDPNAPKKRPADLLKVNYPSCQPQCVSFDNFGAVKCRSMCGHRSGV